jgi:ribosomal protein S18 acetylase RimI-like enzyme
MTFRLKKLTKAELRLTAQALSNAYQLDPLYNFTVPDPEQRRRWLPVLKCELLRNTLRYGQTYIAVGDDGSVRGALALTPPNCYPHPWWTDMRLFWNVLLKPTPWCPKVSTVWPIRRYAATFDKIHYREPHWYIDTVGVDVAWQGQGIGKAFLQQTIALARQSRLPIWLETQTEANVGYYEGFGFRVTVKKQPAPGGPPTWGMLRDA